MRFVLGLLVLKAVVASPRFSRQVDLDSYDDANYDVEPDNINLENHDNYDYEAELTIDDPQVRTCTDPRPVLGFDFHLVSMVYSSGCWLMMVVLVFFLNKEVNQGVTIKDRKLRLSLLS